MTQKQALDKTIDLWHGRWEEGHKWWSLGSFAGCPLCLLSFEAPYIRCGKCLLHEVTNSCGTARFKALKIARINKKAMAWYSFLELNVMETLRHLLQLRLYLYGEIDKWLEEEGDDNEKAGQDSTAL